MLPRSHATSPFPLLSLIVAALLGASLVACGSDDSVSQDELDRAVEEASEQALQEAEAEQDLEKLRRQLRDLKKEGASGDGGSGSDTGGSGSTGNGSGSGGANLGIIPDDARDCGAGVFAKSGSTSCAFALNVANDYFASGSSTFESFSPSTGQAYAMTCNGFDPVICLGGNDAAVYIR